MKGKIINNEEGVLIVKTEVTGGFKNFEIHPRQIKQANDGDIIDFEEVKINLMGREVDPMNYAQNQSDCRWVAKISQTYDESSEKDILYGEIEKAIIEWSVDGTKTAGFLTRKIMNIIK
jgi:hypothetical protein